MIIPLDENTRIVGSEETWNIERLTKPKKGDPKWQARGYYTSFSRALSAALQREIRLHPAVGVSEALEAIDELTRRYAAIFDLERESEPRFN